MKCLSKIRPGFSLIEVTIALGITAFVLVALLGLFIVGANNSRLATVEVEMANLSSVLLARLRTNPSITDPAFAINTLDVAVSNETIFVDAAGNRVPSADEGMYRLVYSVALSPDIAPDNRNRFSRLVLNLSYPAQSTSPRAELRTVSIIRISD